MKYSLKLIPVVCAMCLLSSACATKPALHQQFNSCAVGEECTVSGTLNITVTSHGAVGVLQQQEECVSVALPQNIVEKRKEWEGKNVFVTGIMYADKNYPGVISYEIIGRMMLSGYCSSGRVLYLNSIK